MSRITLLKLLGPADLLCTILGRSGPFFRNMQHNSLFKLLFCPDLTIAMLSWQVFQPIPSNLYIFNELKRTCHTSVHQFALATNSCLHKIQGVNVCLQNHLWLCTPLPKFSTSDLCPSRSLRSASERRFIVPSQRDTKSLSQTFSLTVPIWWNDLPNSIRAAESLTIFKKRLKTHLFHLYLFL